MLLPYRILALGGGGVRGFLQLGALQELEKQVGSLSNQFYEGLYGCSIGSIYATAIGFGMNSEQLIRMSKKFLKFDKIFSSFQFDNALTSFKYKGLFGMDTFEEILLESFKSENIDLKYKKINDSEIPLHIISSNLTHGCPTIFTGDVPVVAAIKASCCIPFVFRPQILYSKVYVDGDVLTNIIMKRVPERERHKTLAFSIIQSNNHITPSNLEKMQIQNYMYRLFKTLSEYDHQVFEHENTVKLIYPNVSIMSAMTEDDQDDMIQTGREVLRSFLASKSAHKESIKC